MAGAMSALSKNLLQAGLLLFLFLNLTGKCVWQGDCQQISTLVLAEHEGGSIKSSSMNSLEATKHISKDPFPDLRIHPGSDEFAELDPPTARHAQNSMPPGAGQITCASIMRLLVVIDAWIHSYFQLRDSVRQGDEEDAVVDGDAQMRPVSNRGRASTSSRMRCAGCASTSCSQPGPSTQFTVLWTPSVVFP